MAGADAQTHAILNGDFPSPRCCSQDAGEGDPESEEICGVRFCALCDDAELWNAHAARRGVYPLMPRALMSHVEWALTNILGPGVA